MLSSIRLVLLGVVLMILGAAIVLLILQNPQHAQFNFLYWTTPVLPFSIFLAMAFGLGSLATLLFSLSLLGRNSLLKRRRSQSSSS
ncbi:lipopolysaccharide assembly protein LapA domain-containing protein [Pseudomonas sp. zbq_18]|uniref:lipopolysaccharide assembly protein LapA domain-containing protein n=1 Tax=Pseudomonas sp. zbq_18 TaxID=3367251 RepID=UPI00370B9634